MYFQYKFSNLLGTVYRKGQLVFSKDGNSIFVPVGNKITCHDLTNNRCFTLPIEVTGNFISLALSPCGAILIASTDKGGLYIISVLRRRLMYKKNTKRGSPCIAFSPNGRYFAAAHGHAVIVYRMGSMQQRVINPFNTEKVCDVAAAPVSCIGWSHDSRLVAFGCEDKMTRVFPVKMMHIKKQMVTLTGDSDTIVGVHFSPDTYDLYVVCRSGKLTFYVCQLSPEDLKQITWKFKYMQRVKKRAMNPEAALEEGEEDENNEAEEEDEVKEAGEQNENKEECEAEERIKNIPLEKTWMDFHASRTHFLGSLIQESRGGGVGGGGKTVKRFATASCLHAASQVLVVASSSGDFVALDMRDGGAILHSLNVSRQSVTSVAISPSGDWVALGIAAAGQLLVWELRSETYVLKQQGHTQNMSVVAYSPDGAVLASGGEDGKIKLWSTRSSFCYVTFSEHSGAISGLCFTQSGRAVLSSSLDGTVRGFDLVRYRNFKTLTSPRGTQFSCLAVDSSGELVAAGGQDCHQVYLWSLKLGSLLEVLSGHGGPVMGLSFSPCTGSSLLVSTAWDGTLRIWDSIQSSQARETLRLSADGVCVCVRPDGQQVAVATMDGHVSLFNSLTGAEEGIIEGRRDLGDKAETSSNSMFFKALCYSSDGQQLLAGGESKQLCVYSVQEQLLMRKYTITSNRTLHGTSAEVNWRQVTRDGVHLNKVQKRLGPKHKLRVPGVMRGDKSLRQHSNQIYISGIAFAPTGRSFVVCCTEGLLIYSQDSDWLFDPLALDITNTPTAVKRKLNEQEYGMALMMAIRLSIGPVIQEVLESIPIDAVPLVVSGLAGKYVEGVLQHVAAALESTRHVGLHVRWAAVLVATHGATIKSRSSQMMTVLNNLQRSLHLHYDTLGKLCADNEYTLAFLRRQCVLRGRRDAATADHDDDGDGGGDTDEDEGHGSDEAADNNTVDEDERQMLSDFNADSDVEMLEPLIKSL